MKPEEIKIGGVYDVRVKVMKKLPTTMTGQLEIGAYTVDRDTQLPMEYEMSWFLSEETPAFVEVTTENDRKNFEPAPKYDPCRFFRKGDKVKLVEWNGRKLWEDIPHLHRIYDENGTFTVRTNELSGSKVAIIPDAYTECVYLACPACLELVTPVEEMERYVVEPGDLAYFIVDKKHESGDQNVVMYMFAFHPHAKEAAEAECARLNEEYRKEQE